MIQSPGGVIVKAQTTTLWEGNTREFQGFSSLAMGNRYASYSQLYREQLWVSVVVNKRARATARLPLKVYLRDDMNRPEAVGSPYRDLLLKPSSKLNRFAFWEWVKATEDIYGEAFLAKVRDRGGRPIELVPLHPTAMYLDDVEPGAEQTWTFRNGKVEVAGIRRSDLVIFKSYNPDSLLRGLSPLEPLRRTLEFEDAAQRAQSSFWRRGARPGVALTHPGQLSDVAADRLKLRWDQIAAGADNTGATVVLEEGLKPELLTIDAKDAEYIDSRKLNREEVCAGYDMPPPVVHILDRATFSNITEQMRSMYRDTMAPPLKSIEETLEHDLRSSVRPGTNGPDFGDDVYAEFLLDEVLRGDFEAQAEGFQKAINSGWMTPAEVRRARNLPFIDGSDQLLVNSTIKPLNDGAAGLSPSDLALMLQKIYLAVGTVISVDEARALLNAAGADLGPTPDLGTPAPQPAIGPGGDSPAASMRSVMGRLSRAESLAEVDSDALTTGLPADLALVVTTALFLAAAAGESVPEFRDRLKALAGG